MNIRLVDIVLVFKKSRECIEFVDFNYFYGQMGAGKSTIARLIDYCLGGSLGEEEMTPALQTEFVSASLSLNIGQKPLVLERDANSNQIKARWSFGEDHFEVLVPARTSAGEVLPDTGVEVLSDLIYYFSGKNPPKVRRSKLNDDSDLQRLSVRDLLWYCYLDQDSMDSSFFHLENDAGQWKRLKSRDVLRFIFGFHQECVTELEIELERMRTERLKCEAGATAIQEALNSSDIASEGELAILRTDLERKLVEAGRVVIESRDRTRVLRSPAMESLQEEARKLTLQTEGLEEACRNIRENLTKYKAYKNELLSLATRFRRSKSAREILSGVDFKNCPCCGNALQARPLDACAVCGQAHTEAPSAGVDETTAEQDLDSRVKELEDLSAQQELQLAKFQRELRELGDQKVLLDKELDRASENYDSAYLTRAIDAEKRSAAIQQQVLDLNKLEVLVQKIAALSEKANTLMVNEQKIRAELKKARELAEKDTQNLTRFKAIFLDCLLRAKIPGFLATDVVEMRSPGLLPEVTALGAEGLAVTSFTNLGSGGKKTLFKCCFAVAVHRLAVEIDAMLPTFMIIDSPMKNISERENRDQFEGFFEMLYDLSQSELRNTQFILVDKELCEPPAEFEPTFKSRHMKPNDEVDKPLIPYYKGK